MRVKLPLFALLAGEFIKETNNELNLNSPELSSSIYLYSISAGEYPQTKKMILIK